MFFLAVVLLCLISDKSVTNIFLVVNQSFLDVTGWSSNKLLIKKPKTLVVLLRYPRRPQPRPSFIMCFDPLLGTLSGWGSTVVVNHCVGVGFQLLLLLLNKIQQDDLSAAWPSFLNVVFLNLFVTSTQCRKHSLN